MTLLLVLIVASLALGTGSAEPPLNDDASLSWQNSLQTSADWRANEQSDTAVACPVVCGNTCCPRTTRSCCHARDPCCVLEPGTGTCCADGCYAGSVVCCANGRACSVGTQCCSNGCCRPPAYCVGAKGCVVDTPDGWNVPASGKLVEHHIAAA